MNNIIIHQFQQTLNFADITLFAQHFDVPVFAGKIILDFSETQWLHIDTIGFLIDLKSRIEVRNITLKIVTGDFLNKLLRLKKCTFFDENIVEF